MCSIGIMTKRVAVILSGCGVYDGTEVHEASAVLVHLSRAGAKVSLFNYVITNIQDFVHFFLKFFVLRHHRLFSLFATSTALSKFQPTDSH